MKKQVSKVANEKHEETEKSKNSIIKLPIFVQNFSEAMIEDEARDLFNSIINEIFFKKIHDSFIKCSNTKYDEALSAKLSRKLLDHEQNWRAFIQRMVDKYCVY